MKFLKKPAFNFVIVFLPIIFFGCATNPNNIAPSYISETKYEGSNCEQLVLEYDNYSSVLDSACKKQESAASKDALGVFLLGLPVSSMSGGDVGPEVARLKGEIVAIQRVGVAKDCTVLLAEIDRKVQQLQADKRAKEAKKDPESNPLWK